jgi:hypothetical protein
MDSIIIKFLTAKIQALSNPSVPMPQSSAFLLQSLQTQLLAIQALQVVTPGSPAQPMPAKP